MIFDQSIENQRFKTLCSYSIILNALNYVAVWSKVSKVFIYYINIYFIYYCTLTRECCLSFNKSNLNWILRPSLNSIGPEIPFISTCNRSDQRLLLVNPASVIRTWKPTEYFWRKISRREHRRPRMVGSPVKTSRSAIGELMIKKNKQKKLIASRTLGEVSEISYLKSRYGPG